MMDLTKFTMIEGSKSDKDLVFLGLSTCGFCKRARKFLDEEGWSYNYIEIDKLDREERIALKTDVKTRFSPDLLYPFLIINDSEYVKGFKKDQWEEKLG
ncbi:MAG: glutaredoxin family protein [Spirochaetales bacterium]|uniref:Glutaredoxin family protein n=1 Tax=Candidatus Thalassospirochaeta sargassi TaxID=3119039 RepID=A0AAJ1IHU7_9SPIO|nr:glutaredoxin family protein [Spirochaetales bacterium]